MAKKRKNFNPFYILVLFSGIAFAITAFAYGVMAFRNVRSEIPTTAEQPSFSQTLDRNGPKWMLLELIILALSTTGAIGMENYFNPPEKNKNREGSNPSEKIRKKETPS